MDVYHTNRSKRGQRKAAISIALVYHDILSKNLVNLNKDEGASRGPSQTQHGLAILILYRRSQDASTAGRSLPDLLLELHFQMATDQHGIYYVLSSSSCSESKQRQIDIYDRIKNYLLAVQLMISSFYIDNNDWLLIMSTILWNIFGCEWYIMIEAHFLHNQ